MSFGPDDEPYEQANTACIAGLGDDIATTSDTLLQSTWYLPAEGPWEPLEDVYVEVIVAVSDVYVPDDGAATCTSLHENNNQFFGEDALPLVSVYDVQLDEGAGAMVGPVYGDGRVTGSDDFASMMTGCRAPWFR